MRTRIIARAAILACIGTASVACAQMVTGQGMPGFKAAFGIDKSPARGYAVEETGARCGDARDANVLWPGETCELVLKFTNRGDGALAAKGRLELVKYGTRGQVGDVWVPVAFKIADLGATPIALDIPSKGSVALTVSPSIPEEFGGYALVADVEGHGRALAASIVRTPKADPVRVQFPTLGIDLVWPHEMSEAVWTARERVGAKACRLEVGPPESRERFDEKFAELDRFLGWAKAHNFAVMLFIGAGGPQPLGRPRPWLDADGRMRDTKSDMAWLPSFDAVFTEWVKALCLRYGWPKGAVNAIELWNEPWEGISISGWGADCLRYREIYRAMSDGIVAARKEAGIQVLIGGTCSSSNTLDKLFCDGTDDFLPILDFASIHYQPMAAVPSLIKKWMERKHENGRVRVWDTESWIANSDDRVAVVMASMRAQGQDRANGIHAGNAFFQTADYKVAQCYPPAAAIAAGQHFIGERPFKELLFKNGLPWIFVFDGLGAPPNPDDGTVVVVGDLAGLYDHDLMLFRGVKGLKNPDAPVLEGASLTLEDGNGAFVLHDFYANPLPSKGGKITVPLNGLGYFLRTDGSAGSFARLLASIGRSRIEGYEPVDVVAHDMLASIEAKPVVRLSVTNILNREVRGALAVMLGELALEAPKELALAPHETREVTLRVTGGVARADNSYPLTFEFDAGADGRKVWKEDLHVNLIAKRTITVDGALDDWRGVLPQHAAAGVQKPTMTEQAWLPFVPWETKTGKGFAVAYLAYDERNFYVAARIADQSDDGGTFSMRNRDVDQYFYPEKCMDGRKELVWPAGVRRYSYRKDAATPSGNHPAFDNVQIAFNALPEEEKAWYSHPPGTMPRFMAYMDTDYEYALNKLAGGDATEIWRMAYPGMDRKHFYPRQPANPLEGTAKGGQLVVRREAGVRIVECALPWEEIPAVKRVLDAGKPVKFSFRVNDDRGPGYELAAGRSVSKLNPYAFHVDWIQHWANELEFGFER